MRICILLFAVFSLAESSSINVSTLECFGLPEKPLNVEGVILFSNNEPGSKECFVASTEPEYYLDLRFNKLNLENVNNICPMLKIYEYSATMNELIDYNDNNLRMQRIVPRDLTILKSIDCKNYKSLIGTVIKLSSPGYKIQIIYDPSTLKAPNGAYEFTITSYIHGPDFGCKTGHIRCWTDSNKCIPESLACDGVDNCYDNSDENNYICTGRINNIPLPLFIIIIIVAVLCFIIVITLIVFCIRRQREKVTREEKEWVDYSMRPLQQQSLLSGHTFAQNA